MIISTYSYISYAEMGRGANVEERTLLNIKKKLEKFGITEFTFDSIIEIQPQECKIILDNFRKEIEQLFSQRTIPMNKFCRKVKINYLEQEYELNLFDDIDSSIFFKIEGNAMLEYAVENEEALIIRLEKEDKPLPAFIQMKVDYLLKENNFI